MTVPEPEPGRFELERPRDLGALLSHSAGLYRRHFLRFIAMAVVVVVPVHAAVLGFGLRQFTGGYDPAPEPEFAYVPLLIQVLVEGPLIAVMALHAVREIAAGTKPRPGASIQAGLDAFTIVFWPVLIAVLCEVASIITIIGPLVLLVRWYFVPQVVVSEERRGPEALRGSWGLTRGFAWRAAGYLLVGNVLFRLAGGILVTPIAVLARSVDSEAVSLAATTLAETLVAAPIGIFAALLYFDLRSRQRALTT